MLTRVIKRKILEWLFKDGVPKLDIGYNTVKIRGSYIDLPPLTSNPTGVEGRLCYNSTDKKARFYDGASWRDMW